MGELREVLPDEFLLKQFVKAGLDSESIFSTGKKRGTRYYAKGKVPTIVEDKIEPKKTEVDDYADSLEHSDLDLWLKSPKPIPGQGVFTKLMKFGKDDNKLNSFFKAGMVTETFYVQHDKVKKCNVIKEKSSHTIYNRIGIKQIGRKYIVQKFNSHSNNMEVESFDDYEDLREYLRILFSGVA